MNEERIYKISGNKEHLDRLENLFGIINAMCSNGASRYIKLFVDGDGSLNFKIYKNNERITCDLTYEKELLFDFSQGVYRLKNDNEYEKYMKNILK